LTLLVRHLVYENLPQLSKRFCLAEVAQTLEYAVAELHLTYHKCLHRGTLSFSVANFSGMCVCVCV